MKHTVAVLTGLATITGFAGLCHAADPAPVPSGLLACEQIKDSAERVRCYDNQVEALKRAAQAPARVATPPVAAATTPPVAAATTPPRAMAATPAPSHPQAPGASTSAHQAAAKFGQEDLPTARQPEPPKPVHDLSAILASIKAIGPEIYLYTLDNGQVWRQDFSNGQPTARFFKTGDAVRIEKTRLGGYQLSVPRLGTKNWVLVRRVK